MRGARLAAAIRKSLTADLLSPEWRKKVKPGDHPTTGHCYVAAESAFYLLGGKRSGWKPMVASLGNGETHWWVKHRTGKVVDPTSSQYLPDKPPYRLGRGSGFLTRTPSRRARTVMGRARLKLSAKKP